MKEYTNPNIEIYILNSNDLIMTLSGELPGDGDGVDYGDLAD